MLEDRDWTRLVRQLKNGDCAPFLGAGACAPTLPVATKLSRQWAAEYDYPFPDKSKLDEVTQFAAYHEMDPVTVKQLMKDKIASVPPPDFTTPTQPHALLASQPISVYLTTNYDNYMTMALEHANRAPETRVCPWFKGADQYPITSVDDEFRPTIEHPLVYHLHGHLEEPGSLVLTAEDYLEFLITLTKRQAREGDPLLPPQVSFIMSTRPLLFIGYSLSDWTFRAVFQGLYESLAEVQRRRHVSIQLTPPLGRKPSPAAKARAVTYLTKYYDKLNISVFWGSAQAFCEELGQRLQAA